jgi:hypothetical protein
MSQGGHIHGQRPRQGQSGQNQLQVRIMHIDREKHRDDSSTRWSKLSKKRSVAPAEDSENKCWVTPGHGRGGGHGITFMHTPSQSAREGDGLQHASWNVV